MIAESNASAEDAWVTRLRQGDPKAYRAIAERYLKPILNFSYRILKNLQEAEDVTQETFARLWQNANTWQPKAKLKPWLFRVAHNLAIDRLRQRHEEVSDEELSSDSHRPSRLLAQRTTVERVRQAVEQLPVRQRSALLLSHFDGLSQPEIAEVLGVSVEAVESLLSRARRTLRQTLESENTE